jgi:hypothetical protein
MSLPTVWKLQDGTRVARYYPPELWGWYSESGELLEHLTPEQAQHKIESQHGEQQLVKT